MMNKKNSNRELNKKVRELFVKKLDDMRLNGREEIRNEGKVIVGYNCERYNNELSNGYKIVWKSYGWYGFKKVWKYIVKEINKVDSGWKLLESSSYRGDGSVYGMSKEYRK